MWENKNQNSSEYGHFLYSVVFQKHFGFFKPLYWETIENIESRRKNLFCRQKVIILRIMRKPETAVPRPDVL